jgi:hypothetical protein
LMWSLLWAVTRQHHIHPRISVYCPRPSEKTCRQARGNRLVSMRVCNRVQVFDGPNCSVGSLQTHDRFSWYQGTFPAKVATPESGLEVSISPWARVGVEYGN